jgi:hypothetical protein
MNQKAQRTAYRVLAAFLLCFWAIAPLAAEGPVKQGKGVLDKPNGDPNITILNINNFTTFLRADGQGNHQVDDQSGGRLDRKSVV